MVKPILEAMYEQRDELVPCFIGDPGIGKTQGLYEFAREKNVNVVTFILSNTVPSEVSGIRMPDKESKRMEVFDDMRMASLKDGDILFFDEILEAPPMLWSACLTLIQDRIMASGRRLPDVFIVAASNRVASPTIIPASTRDRFQFVELKFDFEHWRKWLKETMGMEAEWELERKIQGDSDQYNILTPRRVVKLLKWLAAYKDKADAKDAIDTIKAMFDPVIANMLWNISRKKMSPQDMVVEELKKRGMLDLPDSLGDMSLTSMLEYLQSRSDWSYIEKVLGEAIVESVEEPVIEF